jgi:hypothetical protein
LSHSRQCDIGTRILRVNAIFGITPSKIPVTAGSHNGIFLLFRDTTGAARLPQYSKVSPSNRKNYLFQKITSTSCVVYHNDIQLVHYYRPDCGSLPVGILQAQHRRATATLLESRAKM